MHLPQQLLGLAAAIAVVHAGAADMPGATLLTGTPAQFTAACKTDLDKARGDIVKLKAMKTPRNTVQALKHLDNAALAISFASSRSELAREVEPDEAMRKAADQCGQDASAAATEISLDRGVYDAVKGLDLRKQDKATHYLVEQTLTEFRRAGVDRDAATRAKLAQLNADITKISQQFNQNISSGMRSASFTPAELDGLPDDYRKAHPAGADGRIVLQTTYPDYFPFMQYAKSAAARERFYRAYNSRAYPENMDVLKQLLVKRHELATLLGYKNWAEYSTENKMIGSAQNVADFIAKITAASEARMKADFAELLQVARQDAPAATDIPPWDVLYDTQRLNATKYKFDAQSVRPYFEYKQVKAGLLGIASKMYDVSFVAVPDAKLWHPSVEAYDVMDGRKKLGRIYLDMFPRPNKYSHAANFGLTPGRAGSYLPESVLVCNFPDPDKGPALMEYLDVNTFFHEFGHLMHAIFSGHPKWAGYNYQWDFVEAPSQMFEEWTLQPVSLQLFAKHYQTGAVMPADLIASLRRSQEVGKGISVRRQMSYAALSLHLYDRDPKDIDTDTVWKTETETYTPFHYVPGTHPQASFGHLDSYSANYYTYMWSLVIARDLLTQFDQKGLMSHDVALRYRRTVLEPGASKPAAELVSDFLGRPYSFDAYKAWLDREP